MRKINAEAHPTLKTAERLEIEFYHIIYIRGGGERGGRTVRKFVLVREFDGSVSRAANEIFGGVKSLNYRTARLI